jgi:hypothetical protein
MANRDPRHNALFGVAWTLGYAARIAPAGLEHLVLSAFAGPFGVIAGADEPVPTGQPRPLFHVIRSLAEIAGLASIEVRSNTDDRLAGIAARGPDGKPRLMLANLTAETLTLARADLPVDADASVAMLDADAIADGEGFRLLRSADEIRFSAYAAARVGWTA